jgi:hypothetical protein
VLTERRLYLQKVEEAATALKHKIAETEAELRTATRAEERGAAQRAEAQLRTAELDAEINKEKRELIKLEAEASVLRSVVGDRDASLPIDPQLAEQIAAKDPIVVATTLELKAAENKLDKWLRVGSDPEIPAIKELKAEIETVGRKLVEARKRAIVAATAAVRVQERDALRQRFSRIELEIRIKKAILERLMVESESARKAAAVNDVSGPNVAELRRSLALSQEILDRLMREYLLLRAQLNGVSLNENPNADAKLDAILRELAALRREVQELKRQKR